MSTQIWNNECVPPRTLIALAAERRLIEQEQRVIKLPSGKWFTLVRFKKIGGGS